MVTAVRSGQSTSSFYLLLLILLGGTISGIGIIGSSKGLLNTLQFGQVNDKNNFRVVILKIFLTFNFYSSKLNKNISKCSEDWRREREGRTWVSNID